MLQYEEELCIFYRQTKINTPHHLRSDGQRYNKNWNCSPHIIRRTKLCLAQKQPVEKQVHHLAFMVSLIKKWKGKIPFLLTTFLLTTFLLTPFLLTPFLLTPFLLTPLLLTPLLLTPLLLTPLLLTPFLLTTSLLTTSLLTTSLLTTYFSTPQK